MDAAPHADLSKLAFLLGTWEGGGRGEYPTIEPFDYDEEIEIEHVGDPFLLYRQSSWLSSDHEPLHFERGFLRPGPEPDEMSSVSRIRSGSPRSRTARSRGPRSRSRPTVTASSAGRGRVRR